jgi:hypothetical protein
LVLTTAVNDSLLLSNTVTVLSDNPVGDKAPPTAYFTNNSDVSVTPLPANGVDQHFEKLISLSF